LKRIFWKNIVIQFFLLMGFWLLLSGHYDIIHTLYGVISVTAVLTLHYRLKKYYFFEEEITQADAKLKGGYPAAIRFFRLLFYISWLLWQILVASLQVAYVVLSPKMPIDPSLVRFKTKLPNTVARVILGNSITLTPGTITVQIADDEFIVHALMDVSAKGIEEDALPAEVAKLYDKKPGQVAHNFKVIKCQRDI
jgi:multicomponent Na+:H+ antiporter subunit E